MKDRLNAKQWTLVLAIAAVQFVNILDFVMVMPLGPDFARALDFSEARVGWVGGAYTLAASIAGLIGSVFLDRFERRKALLFLLGGLSCATALGGFATGLPTLIAARLLAGAFGGPATATAIALVSDSVPNSLRGRALGVVMGAFSLAAVFGVPAGLWVAEQTSWRGPFFAVATLGGLVTLFVSRVLPSTAPVSQADPQRFGIVELLSMRIVQVTYSMTAITMMAGFVLIPNLSAFLQLNLSVPREELKHLYFLGGISSFVFMQLGGMWVDRFGSFKTSLVGAVVVGATLVLTFIVSPPLVSPLVFFLFFMGGMALRNVSYSTLNTKVPSPSMRGRYQSLSSSVQSAASAFAAGLSAQMLSKEARPPDFPGESPYILVGVQRVAIVALLLNILVPVFLWWIERELQKKCCSDARRMNS